MNEESIVIINEWSIVHRPDDRSCLGFHGFAFGHPKFSDGQEITTSQVVAYDSKAGIFRTRSGRKYKLGTMDPKYRALNPEAEETIMATLKDLG